MDIRSFLAFEMPVSHQEILSQTALDLKKTSLDVRWVKVENIHLTLIFLGNVPENRLNDIKDAIRMECSCFGPLHIALKGLGVFGSKRNPRVIWIGLEGDIQRMSDLKDTVSKRLVPFGIKEEKRRFNPHLTLGRFRKGAQFDTILEERLSKYQGLTGPSRTLEKLVLYKSDLKPTGAVYTELDSWSLSGKN